MKQPILILSSLLCICGLQCARASDYLEEEPIATPIVIEEEVDDVDNVLLSDDEYVAQDAMDEFQDTMDDLLNIRSRVEDLLAPGRSSQNLWTDDEIVSNDESEQAVVILQKKDAKQPVQTGFSLGEQNYYGETVYIINNFLYGAEGNGSVTYGAYTNTKNGMKCPFNTPKECSIWLRKPVISETVAPRSNTLRSDVMCDISDKIEKNPHISANDKTMLPLLNRYHVLMRASQSCCTGGLTYKLQKAGAPNELIYKFLADDVNFSGFGARCLVMNDAQIENTEKFEATSATVADVRNGCLCKSKDTFKALLAPFEQLYKEYPRFADAPFEYKHFDGVGRSVTDYVNADVQNVLNQLEKCP